MNSDRKHFYHREFCGRMNRTLVRALVLVLPMAVAGLLLAAVPAQANTDVTNVENALVGAPVQMYSYGTVVSTSASCFSAGDCWNTGGNPFTTAASLTSPAGDGSAKAGADLSTGFLGARASEDGITGASAAAGAGFWDTLTFSGASGGETGTLTFNLPGSFTDVGYGGACEGYALTSGTLSNGSNCGGSSTGADPFGATVTVLNSGNPSETLRLNFPLENGVATRVAFALGTAVYNSFNPATADLYDPPQVRLVLPNGVTYTSASGVFLTSPVPLPSAAWLFVSGILGLVSLARRRRVSEH